ncbi:MAG: c-type cytochrome [Deltaproteobacteria bacterium]|nr:c-type cytochrome [Deltaproteobacteria bacterium]
MRASRQRCAALWVAFAMASCVDRVSAERRGAEVFASPQLSTSRFNQFSCRTCHRADPRERPDAILPGGLLAGSTARPTFWGGTVVSLQEAIDVCFRKFMRGGPLDTSNPDTIALYAFLQSLEQVEGAQRTALAFTVRGTTVPPMMGDATRGALLYTRACATCHGPVRATQPPITTASVVPTDTEAEHGSAQGYTQATLQQVLVEKSRHGAFLGFAGIMPPFSEETLSDQDLADIVAHVGPVLR